MKIWYAKIINFDPLFTFCLIQRNLSSPSPRREMGCNNDIAPAIG